eukprot:XP_011678268.1 PREDICTED: histone-lysine N-methyltransferase PRDM9 isoform X1 [Strongylocentrotus purpuratus]
MEPNYQPGFYLPERDQQEHVQHLQPSQQQQQPQQHVAPYPMDLPYHTTSQHQPEFVVDQPLRTFPVGLHPGAPILRSIYQDSAPILASSSIVPQARHQVPFTLGGHEVKSAALSANYTPPITSSEPIVESNILPITTCEQVPGSNAAQLQGKTDVVPEPSKQTQREEQPEHPSTTHHPRESPPAHNTSAVEPPLLVALNLKKNRMLSSSPDLPQGLSFKRTSLDKVEGVVARETIEKGVEFGPYTGTLLNEEYGWFKDSTWEICVSGRVFFYIDGRKTWMSHLSCAQSEEEQNTEAYQIYGEIYFRSTKVVEPGSELKVFYSEDYRTRLGFQTRLNDLTFNQDAQKFQCSQCEGLFTSAKLILRHIRCEHTSRIPDEMIPVLTWKEKKKSTENEVTSKLHLVTKTKASDQEEQVFTCGTCEKMFPSCGRLKAHELFHEYNQEHMCPLCGKGQTNAQALTKHMTTHESKLHKCKKCTRKFKSETALSKHEREAHGYRCQFCLERFTRKNECMKHEQTHQAFKSLQSDTKETPAEKTETSQPMTDEAKDMLGKTSNYYLKKRPYKCRFCPKRYISRCSARDHEKEAHTKEGSYKCSHCPRVFTSERRLIEHLISHEQKGFYQCTLCPKSFGSESALSNHQGEHTGLKPFKCEICGRGFRVKNHFHAHKRRMHQERPLRFFCSVCNKGFADKGNLTKHERRHKGIRQYVCLECGKGFTAGTSLATHMQTMHSKEKRFSCEICGKKFSLNNHYTHHMIKHKIQEDANIQE